MTKLEAKARELAGALPMHPSTDEIAEAITKTAREFAADALLFALHVDEWLGADHTIERLLRQQKKDIAAAIKAAGG